MLSFFGPRAPDPAAARASFQSRREELQEAFFEQAAGSGRPRGLAWVGCDFADDLTIALDTSAKELVALLDVDVRFEAIEGGGMEDNPNVSRVRAATAVFHHRQGEWTSDGRVVFNLGPAETIDHFAELEALDEGG